MRAKEEYWGLMHLGKGCPIQHRTYSSAWSEKTSEFNPILFHLHFSEKLNLGVKHAGQRSCSLEFLVP